MWNWNKIEILSSALTKSVFGKFLQSVQTCLVKEDIPSAATLRTEVGIVNTMHKEIQKSKFEDGR